MQRIAIGILVGLAAWFGSALAAEAQTIQPTGPLAVISGSTTSTYTATVTLTAPSLIKVRLWVYRNGTQFHYSETFVPNNGTTTVNFSKPVSHSLGCNTGDTFKYSAKLIVAGQTITAADWIVTVTGTRPATKPTQVEKRPELALQNVDRDRRRE